MAASNQALADRNKSKIESSQRLRRKVKSIINQFSTLLRFNKAQLYAAIGYVSPFEFKKRYYDNLTLSGIAV